MRTLSPYILCGLLLGGCGVQVVPLREPSPGHLKPEPAPTPDDIPMTVSQVPFLPPPKPAPRLETYTVVVNDVPVRDLLFALARDARVNVDIHPGITGAVTLNAIDQTLPQILERIADQVDLRYTIDANRVAVSPDAPYLQTYRVDYVNMSRETETRVQLATQLGTTTTPGGEGGGGVGGANSTTSITNRSTHRFWETLAQNILNILGEEVAAGAGKIPSSSSLIVNPESGVVTVRATARQHRAVNEYLSQVLASAHRQVLIEATVVEVELSDEYQAGVDWENLAQGAGWTVSQVSPSFRAGTSPFFTASWTNANDLSGTIRLLSRFGNARTLSSPKLMVMNNQTSVLKVVRNVVYFTIDVTITEGTDNNAPRTDAETNIHTVPVGLVMNVTPQVSEGDAVILNVRPSISSVVRFVSDPNPVLKNPLLDEPINNEIPEVETREMESVLRVGSGQIAVLGGLMKDEIDRASEGVPFLMDIPFLGNLFQYRDDRNVKSELVIFIRPVVVRDPSIDTDLRQLRPYLDQTVQPDLGLPAPLSGEAKYESIVGRP